MYGTGRDYVATGYHSSNQLLSRIVDWYVRVDEVHADLSLRGRQAALVITATRRYDFIALLQDEAVLYDMYDDYKGYRIRFSLSGLTLWLWEPGDNLRIDGYSWISVGVFMGAQPVDSHPVFAAVGDLTCKVPFVPGGPPPIDISPDELVEDDPEEDIVTEPLTLVLKVIREFFE